MANPVQQFIDSAVGIVLATLLHTLGAILLLAGVAIYMFWHRELRAGRSQPGLLAAAAGTTYLAIAANLVGGFMRTYEEGHPRLDRLDDSAWVQVMLVKHVFLFLAMGAAVVLIERVARLALERHKAGQPVVRTPGHKVGVGLVLLGIGLASVLGAVSKVTPLTPEAPHVHIPEDPEPEPAAPHYHNTSGQLTSTPAQPAQASGPFDVPAGAAALEASLGWTPSQFSLGLMLTAPDGSQTPAPAASGGSLTHRIEQPEPGRWGFAVTSELAVAVTWSLTLRITFLGDGEQVLESRELIPPGQFFEINTEMPADGTMHWDWSAPAQLSFDVHSHFDNEVQYHVREDTTEHAGKLTVERKGGYSYLWQNNGTLPVELTYKVWGPFTVDSYFPPR